jgi:hypothetical protein
MPRRHTKCKRQKKVKLVFLPCALACAVFTPSLLTVYLGWVCDSFLRIWKQVRNKGSDKCIQCLTSMTIAQFARYTAFLHFLKSKLLEDLSQLEFPGVPACMKFANKILCVFIWLVKYPDYSELALTFSVSIFTISLVIRRFVLLY